MKNIVSIYAGILLIVFALGVGLDTTKKYDHERIIWFIQNDFQKMVNQPKLIPEGAIANIIGRYERFIHIHPKSPLTPKAALSVGNIYVFLNDYSKAREIFEQIIKDYSYNAEIVAKAQLALGKSYEDEGHWDQASTIYKMIIAEHPLTSTGFYIPFYIAQYSVQHLTQLQSEEAFEEAVEFYQNMAANNHNDPLEYLSLTMLTTCRLAQGRWQEAFDAAKQKMFRYPSEPALFDNIQTIKDICIEKMNDISCAVNTYQEFMRKNPGHPINPALVKIIANINHLRHR